jgi:hypothetical protein
MLELLDPQTTQNQRIALVKANKEGMDPRGVLLRHSFTVSPQTGG